MAGCGLRNRCVVLQDLHINSLVPHTLSDPSSASSQTNPQPWIPHSLTSPYTHIDTQSPLNALPSLFIPFASATNNLLHTTPNNPTYPLTPTQLTLSSFYALCSQINGGDLLPHPTSPRPSLSLTLSTCFLVSAYLCLPPSVNLSSSVVPSPIAICLSSSSIQSSPLFSSYHYAPLTFVPNISPPNLAHQRRSNL